MEVLYCFGGGAATRVGIHVNFGVPLAASSPRVAAPPPKKYPGQKNPASYAG